MVGWGCVVTPETVFARVFEGQTVTVPSMTVSYEATIGGRQGRVCHTISEVIYSAFDMLLSQQVQATQGLSLPRAKVETVFLTEGMQVGHAASGCATILDALVQIVDKAGADREHHFFATPGEIARHLRDLPYLRPVVIDPSHAGVMRSALSVLGDIADPGFCRVAATLDGMTVCMPDSTEVFAEFDFHSGVITFPCRTGDHVKAPLLALAAFQAQSSTLRARLRAVQDAIREARRRAVDNFGSACDAEIVRLQASIGGRRLEGHVLEVAGELIDRLVAALGPRLSGLSPHARLVALDWLSVATPEHRAIRDMAA